MNQYFRMQKPTREQEDEYAVRGIYARATKESL